MGKGGGGTAGSKPVETKREPQFVSNPSDLRKGETYEVKYRGEFVDMTYVGGSVVNGDAVRDFSFTLNGKRRIYRLENDDVTRRVRK